MKQQFVILLVTLGCVCSVNPDHWKAKKLSLSMGKLKQRVEAHGSLGDSNAKMIKIKATQIPWFKRNANIDIEKTEEYFSVIITINVPVKDRVTDQDFLIRWRRVGCDKMVEGIFMDCELPESSGPYMAVMDGTENKVVYRAEQLTYNSRYWVEIISGDHSTRRQYFFTPACRHVDQSMTRCTIENSKEKTIGMGSSIFVNGMTVTMFIGVMLALVALVVIIAKRNKQFKKYIKENIHSFGKPEDSISCSTVKAASSIEEPSEIITLLPEYYSRTENTVTGSPLLGKTPLDILEDSGYSGRKHDVIVTLAPGISQRPQIELSAIRPAVDMTSLDLTRKLSASHGQLQSTFLTE